MVITYSKVCKPGYVANSAHGQLNMEKLKIDMSLSLYAPENLVSRDGFGRPVPCQPAHFPHSS